MGKTSPPARCSPGDWKHPHGRGEDHGTRITRLEARETPPRAWGRLKMGNAGYELIRNTPTGVGKTACYSAPRRPCGKHPHGRGEDCAVSQKWREGGETPPRAWGRHQSFSAKDTDPGNTPTGVGKTFSLKKRNLIGQKHPHGRGEDTCAACSLDCSPETPPRAWGRPCAQSPLHDAGGNTPTGVGKTYHIRKYETEREKHPHGRGEDDMGQTIG